jgi:phosphoadenosine phosphosulfate reductase
MDIELYKLNAEMNTYKSRLKQATVQIHRAFEISKCWYVAWSGGKDSTVLAHLVSRLYPGTVIWSEKDDCDFPGELEYVKNTAKRFDWNLELTIPEESLWAEVAKGGLKLCEDIHSRGKAFSDDFFYAAIEKQEQKHAGVFLGLRGEESRGRYMNFKQRGFIYQRKNGKYTCIPLAKWSGIDIFSYLITNEIPIFDIYYKTKFHEDDPTRIRKSWVLPGSHARKGYCAWLRYYYPEIFLKLAAIYPKVKSYV